MWRIARWFIALSEIGAGALMLSIVLYPPSLEGGQRPAGWTIFLAESLGVAAIVAGVNLFRNSPFGYRMSLGVQAIQILRVYGGRFVFAVIIGPQILINVIGTPGSIPVGGPLGFAATLYLTLSGAASASARGIGINVFALVASWELSCACQMTQDERGEVRLSSRLASTRSDEVQVSCTRRGWRVSDRGRARE